MKVYYQLFVYDKNEKLKRKTKTIRSRSFLKPLLYQLCPITGGSAIVTIDINNSSRTPTQYIYSLCVAHPGKDSRTLSTNVNTHGTSDRVGIQVGTGTAVVAITDYAMNAKINNGSGAGQFVYYGCWVSNFSTGASSCSFDIERIFKNNSSGSITVNETGLYDLGRSFNEYSQTGSTYNFCLIRDKLSSGVAVANGEYLKVKYTITVTV